MKEQWSKDCREKKGTNIGDLKNYVIIGLLQAALQDKDISAEDKTTIRNLMTTRIQNAEGELDMTRAKRMGDLVGHCQVTRTKNRKKAFINLMFRRGEGKELERMIYAAMDREGDRQYDPAPPKPVHKNLKDALQGARNKRR